MRALLDVNVLIALLDVDHVHHVQARTWLNANVRAGWASCPITQNGCVRVMSQPNYPGARPIGAVIERAQAGAVHHVGRSPQRLEGMADRVAMRKRLMQELETAIAAEQYERAARLRDQLQGLGDVGGKA